MDNNFLPRQIMSASPFGGTIKAPDIVSSDINEAKEIGPENIIKNTDLMFFSLVPLYTRIKYLEFSLYDQFRADIWARRSVMHAKLISCEYNRPLLNIVGYGTSSKLNALPNDVFIEFKEWLMYQAFKSEDITWVARCGRYKIFDPVDKNKTELATIHIFLPWSTVCEPKVEVNDGYVVEINLQGK